jgi:AraC-like DNA-binding protein
VPALRGRLSNDDQASAPRWEHDHQVTDPDRLRGILDLVEESLDEPDLRADELAGRAYLSRFHFDRLVTAALGEPPGAFRRRLLLERAAYRLLSTSTPVIDVAVDSGYSSAEAFTRAFARAYGRPPTRYRSGPPSGTTELPSTRELAHRITAHSLAAPSGIHFHPPGGLRLPATRRSTPMDVLTRMLDHHLWLTGEIIDRSARLDDEQLDRPITLSVEGIDDNPSLRGLTDRLVGQLEMWVKALEGGTSMPEPGDTSVTGLKQRLAVAGPRFRELVITPVVDGRSDETFVDAVCEPPETFTFGGVLSHVLTFAAVRRTMAIGALESAGVTDLGAGDPMRFVGGTGDDASTITRRRDDDA